jgi:glycosyltransferase involved in cell wall biosynthesis
MKKLAVLLPTYNCAKYLQESIDSILNQTYSDFDLYIYDDCSTDNTSQLVANYSDQRIFYIKNSENFGIAKTLNFGLEKLLPNYEYIARMDADDWAFPERFEKQIDFLGQNKSIGLCGTQGFWLTNISETPLSGWQYPTDNNYLKLYLLFAASFGHSSVILRSDCFILNGLKYNEDIKTCEDWDLWIRVSKNSKVHNLPDFLMKYRIVPTSNHRSAENKNLHLKERSVLISNYWKTFDIALTPQQVFEYYYDSLPVVAENFQPKLRKLINCFNKLYLNHAIDLNENDVKKVSYLLARRITDYRKRSNLREYGFNTWFILLYQIKFIDSLKLIKSQFN